MGGHAARRENKQEQIDKLNLANRSLKTKQAKQASRQKKGGKKA
jgi:hypothetical protein